MVAPGEERSGRVRSNSIVSISILVSTFDRPWALKRTLPQVAALDRPTLVCDDGSDHDNAEENCRICMENGALYLRLPQNRGLATVMNAGLSFWLADNTVQSISYIQDDCDVHPQLLVIMSKLQKHSPILTGHDARAHKSQSETALDGMRVKFKATAAGVHLHCTAEFWRGLFPFPTNSLGTPKRNPAELPAAWEAIAIRGSSEIAPAHQRLWGIRSYACRAGKDI